MFASAHQIIGESYAYKGDYERALSSYQSAAKVAALGREDHEQLADRGFALARAGRSREAQRVLAELLERHRRNPKGVAANIATIYVALGQSEPAFMWLAKAVELRDPEIGTGKSIHGGIRFARTGGLPICSGRSAFSG